MTKQLNLDRELIDSTIQNYFQNKCFFEKKSLKSSVQYIIKSENLETEITLAFYLINDGTTTITYKLGKNQIEGEKLALFLKEKCVSDHRKNVSLNIGKNFSKSDFDDFLEYLKLDLDNKILIDIEQVAHGIKYKIKHIEKEDGITLTLYNLGTLCMQGKPLFLFNYTMSYFIEIGALSIKDYGTTIHKVTLNINVLEELEKEIPKAYPIIGTKLKNIMSSTLFIKNIDVELLDYSFVVFPILRGVEGVLKDLIIRYKISDAVNLKTFNMFQEDSSSKIYSLKPEYERNINSEEKLNKLNELYNFYYRHRHQLFHVGNFDFGTRLLNNKHEALSLITEAIEHIENNY